MIPSIDQDVLDHLHERGGPLDPEEPCTECERLQKRVRELEEERARALAILAPPMADAGLEEACRSVKQAAILRMQGGDRIARRIQNLENALRWLAGLANELLAEEARR